MHPAKQNAFLVTLGPLLPDLLYSESVVVNAAKARSGVFRSEIANAITRKKVPFLLFRVLPCPTLTPNPGQQV